MSVIGRKFLPCGHQRLRIPDVPGDIERTCDTCKMVYFGTVIHSDYWSRKIGEQTYVLEWEDEERVIKIGHAGQLMPSALREGRPTKARRLVAVPDATVPPQSDGGTARGTGTARSRVYRLGRQ